MFDTTITTYSSARCGDCRAAKRALDAAVSLSRGSPATLEAFVCAAGSL